MTTNKRVLVVDDDSFYGHVIQSGLARFQYDVTLLTSGESMIQYLQSNVDPPVDIILIDQIMRGMSGLDTFLEIRKMGIDIPVIMVTGNSSINLVKVFIKNGGDDFIEKPIDSFEILDFRIKKALEQSESRKLFSNKSRILKDILHDVRGPLSAVDMRIKLALDYIDPQKDNKTIELLRNIKYASSNVMELICNVLTVSVLESGEFDYEFRTHELVSLVNQVIQDQEIFLVGKNISLQFREANSSIRCIFDILALKRVISNLVSNAIKFSDNGGCISIFIEDHDHMVMIAIRDNGAGIPESEISSIFDRYMRSAKTRKQKEGIGLGLAICRNFILAHKGKLWAENNLDGKGATFYFQIPKHQEITPE